MLILPGLSEQIICTACPSPCPGPKPLAFCTLTPLEVIFSALPGPFRGVETLPIHRGIISAGEACMTLWYIRYIISQDMLCQPATYAASGPLLCMKKLDLSLPVLEAWHEASQTSNCCRKNV